MSRRIGFGLLVATCLTAPSCADLSDPRVVEMAGGGITLEDVRIAYTSMRSDRRPLLNTREARLRFVEDLLERRLLVERGAALHTPSEEPDLLVERLETLHAGSYSPTDAEIESATVRATQVTLVDRLRFPDSASALEASRRARQGVSFDELEREGPGVRVPGELWVRWGFETEPLHEIASRLEVGEVSDPYREDVTDFVLRVVDRRGEPPGPPASLRSSVLRGLHAHHRAVERERLAASLREEHDLRIVDEGIRLVTSRTGESILSGEHVQLLGSPWAIPVLADDEKDEPVALADGRTILTAGDYAEGVARLLPGARPRGGYLERQVRRVAGEQATHRLLEQEARRRNVGADWWVRRARERELEEVRVRAAMRAFRDSAEVTPASVDSLTAIFRDFAPQTFEIPARSIVIRFDLPTREASLEEIARIEEAGGSMARVAQIIEGDPAWFGNYHIVDGITIQAGGQPFGSDSGAPPNGILGPIEGQGAWSLAEVVRRYPAREMTPEEIRSNVTERLRADRGTAAAERWVKSRRRELGVVIHESVLDDLSPGF